jgi:REP element-mobilizing transposase RayT
MARELRIIDPNAIYHVICNGNNWGPIAFDGVDLANLRRELDKAATRYEWQVFGWVFLHTHYHVMLRAPKRGFSEGFRELNGNHSRRTNRRHDRRDHLFRNRPWVKPVLSDAQFIRTTLYIALNPVLAGVCSTAAAWAHGSYRALIGRAPAPPWLAVDHVLRFFGRTPERARSELEDMVHARQLLVSDTEDRAAAG